MLKCIDTVISDTIYYDMFNVMPYLNLYYDVIVWELNLQLCMQSVSITINVVSSNPGQARCTR